MKHGHCVGHKRSSEMGSWRAMIQRCTNSNHKDWHSYGGRGITVCDRWLHSFEFFLQDMGLKPDTTYSIDRIDVNGNYEPYNCRWASTEEQSMSRRDTRKLTFNNKTLNLKQWSKIVQIPYNILRQRYDLKWTPEKILTTQPIKKSPPITITYKEQVITLTELSKITNIKRRTIYSRLQKGWSIEDIVNPKMRINR
jgi:hypothetical protein